MVSPGKEDAPSKSNKNITASDINKFSFKPSLLKLGGGYIHKAVRIGQQNSILTDGMEDETEEINRMGSGDSIRLSELGNSNIHLKDYKGCFLRGV